MLPRLKKAASSAICTSASLLKFLTDNPVQAFLASLIWAQPVEANPLIKYPEQNEVLFNRRSFKFTATHDLIFVVIWGTGIVLSVSTFSYVLLNYIKNQLKPKSKLKKLKSVQQPRVMMVRRRFHLLAETQHAEVVHESQKRVKGKIKRIAQDEGIGHNQLKKQSKQQKKQESEYKKLERKRNNEAHRIEWKLKKQAEAEAKKATEREAQQKETFDCEEKLSREAKVEGLWRGASSTASAMLYDFEIKKHKKPSTKKCKKYIAELESLMILCRHSENETQLEKCLHHAALLFLVSRWFMAKTHIEDRIHPERKETYRHIRYMLQHGTMEVDVKTTVETAEKVSLTSPFIKALEAQFGKLSSNDLVANDKKYYDWVQYKIVPVINQLVKSDSPVRDFALIKLLSFIGEYYNDKRFTNGSYSVTQEVADLLSRIRSQVRNRTEHLNSDFLHVINRDQIRSLCSQLKREVTSAEADLTQMNDQFNYSLRYFKRSTQLNPNAPEFKLEDALTTQLR